MSIEIFFIDGRACPFVSCDICGEKILKPQLAMAAWGESGYARPDDHSVLPCHVHKGRCLNTFEASLQRGYHLMTDELVVHVAFILKNSCLTRLPDPDLEVIL